tara:strand:+ start:21897 stop:22217 length:321 start_codon:yes stop_codon:yes gene_type:complete
MSDESVGLNVNNNINYNLEEIRQKIEKMSKQNHVEILKLLHEKNIKFTENDNGVFLNLTNLNPEHIELLLKYINHIKNQENILNIIETKKEEIENTYFKDNKDINE